MSRYLLLIRHEPGAYSGLAPNEMQDVLTRYKSWVDRLKDSGAYVASEKLADDGRTVRRQVDGGHLEVSDGPYAESKDVVAGFYLIEAHDYEHAAKLARLCPIIDRGVVEVRRLAGG
jgi:hypothetical protein